jgi:hypothetical protein
MSVRPWLAALLLPMISCFALLLPSPVTIYVDCSAGSDSFGHATASSPLASPTAARDRIRSLQPLTADVTVIITGTCVPTNADGSLNFSLPVLSLAAEDSAPEGFSISYTSSSAVLMGGMPLDSWQPYKGQRFMVLV